MENSSSPKNCPKCEAMMEDGFIRDNTHGGNLASEWIEGQVEKSFWVGVKTKGKTHYQIRSYRCSRCGFLESYAG